MAVDDISHQGQQSCEKHDNKQKCLRKLGLIAALSAFWLLVRTGTKPSRITYPCQQAALSNMEIFKLAVLAAIPSINSIRSLSKNLVPYGVLGLLVIGFVHTAGEPILLASVTSNEDDYSRIPIKLSPNTANLENSSDIFLMQNVTSLEGNMTPSVRDLIDEMNANDLHFYNTTSNPTGLISRDDVVLLKVNGQWNQRGGTNTDLVKAIIEAILDHPDEFIGEIVISDNGQGLGSFDYLSANAFDHEQSMQEVVDMFASQNVSSYLWDDIRDTEVLDYDEGDMEDGYVLSSIWDDEAQIRTSYPKFTTAFGTHISFKNGIWSPATGFDSQKLKVINMPVMKSHHRYGVTGCIKNYMGVPKGQVISSIHYNIPHEHFSIAYGGMGKLMVETRFPILNILDMIWTNPHPMESSSSRGPRSRYTAAAFTDILGVSQDPAALDYWASKHVLSEAAKFLNYTAFSSLDPDYAPISEQYYGYHEMDESFCNYLNRSKNILRDAGIQATTNPDQMNVYIIESAGYFPTTPTTTPDNDAISPLLVALVALSVVGATVVLIAIARRKKYV